MRIVIAILTVFTLINCSSSPTGTPPAPGLNCPTVTPGTGSAAITPDWTHDFTTQTQLDSTVWTPEVTISGEGNFEFEAYVNSSQTIGFDSTNGLSLKADLMQNYLLQTGQTFSNGTSSVVPGSILPIQDILGCSRTVLADGFGGSTNNIGSTCSSNWQLDFLNTCTDNGSVDAFPYGCEQSSGFGGGGIGAGVPLVAATMTAAPTPPTSAPAVASTIVPPVISARISTKLATNPAISNGFRYGRLEIVAKIPKGDWLWPAIWMMPVNNTASTLMTSNPINLPPGKSAMARQPVGQSNPAGIGYYGAWPRSGEIDILESRGNTAACAETYMNAQTGGPVAFGGTQSYASTLHWGPYYSQNSFSKTHTEYYTDLGYAAPVTATASTLDAGFHTYGLRWSPQGIYTYIDNDSNHVLEVSFSQSFYTRGTTSTQECLKTYANKNGAPVAPGTCDPAAIVTKAANQPDGSAWADNPWGTSSCTANAAPFDQPFYLIMNLAIGGTAGEGTTAYFPDGYCQKPWHNPLGASDTWSYPVANFFTAISGANSFSGAGYGGWQPSWGNPNLQVKTIKYWTEPNAGAFGALKHPS